MAEPYFPHVERTRDEPLPEHRYDAGEPRHRGRPVRRRPTETRSAARLRRTALTAALAAALALGRAPAAPAADPAPQPTPTPALVLSTKPMPGCCCYPHLQKPGEWGCAWGMQEEKCMRVGALIDKPYRWTPGRCPEPK